MSTHHFCARVCRVSVALSAVGLVLLALDPRAGHSAVQAEPILLPLVTKQILPAPGRILYTAEVTTEEYASIFVVNSSGTGHTRITTGVNAWEPDWSPDGQKLVFTGYCGPQGGTNLCILNADGSGLVPLTQYDAIEKNAAWSPDGTRIAFSSNLGGSWNLHTVNADGTNRVQLTDDSASDFDPAWSPDGSKLAFESNREDGNPEIFVMDLETLAVSRLTNDILSDWTPTWSPDGTTIAWQHGYRIFLMNADGTSQKRLTTGDYQEWHPTWSPNGEWVAYDRLNPQPVIAVIRTNGSDYYEITAPTDIGLGHGEPDWGP